MRENGSVRAKVHIVRQVSCDAEFGVYICACTIARIRQDADKEHSKQDPKIPGQPSLCMSVDSIAFACVVCSCGYLLVTVFNCVCARFPDPRASAL